LSLVVGVVVVVMAGVVVVNMVGVVENNDDWVMIVLAGVYTDNCTRIGDISD